MALRIFFFISLFVSVTARYNANHTNTNRTTRPQTRVGFIRSAYKYDRGLLNWVITGVVKVWHEGRWGTICDDRFNDRAANVICRSMGYRQGLHYDADHHFKHPIYPGQRNMTIWLDDVRCTGRERDIGQCRHSGWGRHNCGHSEDVTIGCLTPCVGCTVRPHTAPQPSQPPHANHTNTNGTTRPYQRTPVSFISSVSSYDRSIGGLVRRGVVKVYHNGRWGTICDDEFDNIDATVICNSMGYRYGYHYGSNIIHPEQRNMTIWLDNVRCTGLELTISQCRHNGWGRHNCGHREDVIIGCHNLPSRNVTAHTTPPPTQPPQPVNTTVGWAGRPVAFNHGGRYPVTTTAGIVKVYHNGRWGTICDDNFSHGSAQVLCRKMGYRYGVHYRPSFTVDGRPRNGMPIWLDNFNCRGHEQNIDDCDHNPWGQHDCGHREDAIIGCSNNPNLLRQTHHRPIIPWTPRPWTQEPHRPWTHRPWTHRPWTHRPWTEPHYTRSYNDYVTYTDVRQLRYEVMRFLRTVYRGFAEGLSNAAQGFHSRLEYLTRPRSKF